MMLVLGVWGEMGVDGCRSVFLVVFSISLPLPSYFQLSSFSSFFTFFTIPFSLFFTSSSLLRQL
jgi:hypothetical protein